MKKVLCLIYPNFSLYEITALTSTLALSFDITIDYVASEHSIVVSEDGLHCQPTKTLDQICIEEYSCVILPKSDCSIISDSAPKSSKDGV